MEKTNEYKIPEFPGNKPHKLAYQEWAAKVQIAASNAFWNMRDNQGVLSWLLNLADYTTLTGNAADLHARTPEPIRPIAAGGNAVSIQQHANQLQAYQDAIKNYQTERTAFNRFRQALLESLDPTTYNALGTFETILAIPLTDIFYRVKTLYGRINAKDLLDEIETLNNPYSTGGNIQSFIDKHKAVHRLCHINLNPISELQKIDYFRRSIRDCGLFDYPITVFEDTYTISMPERTFEIFTTRILHHSETLSHESGTKILPRAFSTQKRGRDETAQESTIPSEDSEIQQLKRQMANLTKKQNNARPIPKDKLYCYTHGYGSHHGIDCKRKNPRHKDEATCGNTMGGSIKEHSQRN